MFSYVKYLCPSRPLAERENCLIIDID